MNSSDPTKKN